MLYLIREAPKSLIGTLKFISSCLQHPVFTVLFIKNRILGETLTHELAIGWLQRN